MSHTTISKNVRCLPTTMTKLALFTYQTLRHGAKSARGKPVLQSNPLRARDSQKPFPPPPPDLPRFSCAIFPASPNRQTSSATLRPAFGQLRATNVPSLAEAKDPLQGFPELPPVETRLARFDQWHEKGMGKPKCHCGLRNPSRTLQKP